MKGPNQTSNLLRIARPHRKKIIVILLLTVGWSLSLICGPALVAYAIDQGIRRHSERPVEVAVIGYFASALASGVLFRQVVRSVTNTGERVLQELRVSVFNHILSMPMGFFDSERTGRLVSRMTTDMDALENLIQQGLVQLVSNALLLLITLCVLLIMSPILFLFCLISVPILAAASVWFKRKSAVAYMSVRDAIAQTMTSLQEGLSGVRVIQAFANEDVVVRGFSGQNRAQLLANMRAVSISARYFPVIEAMSVFTTAGIVGIGGYMSYQHLIPIGTVVAFALYMGNLFSPIQQTSQQFDLLQSAGAAFRKLDSLLNIEPPLAEATEPRELNAVGAICFENVTFTYAEEAIPALQDINISIDFGKHVALVGPTGAGKSTIAKLIARFYDPTIGKVSFGGIDLRQASFDSLRRTIVVVTQEAFLFDGTIASNIRMGRSDISDIEVYKAIEEIGGQSIIESIPGGIGANVFEGGSTLSAGEKQIISLARVALIDPRVIILDEATSNLDPATETLVEEALTRLTRGKTLVTIAHRLSTAQRADQVLVVDNGIVAQQGHHDELIQVPGLYSTLNAAWLGVGGSKLD